MSTQERASRISQLSEVSKEIDHCIHFRRHKIFSKAGRKPSKTFLLQQPLQASRLTVNS